jgi:hypothetical protein
VSETKIYPIEYDLRYLESGLLDLEGYLLSQELYWPVGVSAPPGGPPYPRLTLGNLLLSQARLQPRRISSTQMIDLERMDKRLDETRTRWLSAWRQKAQREFAVRINLWRDFLEDYRTSPSGNVDRYTYEVNRRVILDFLEPQSGTIPPAESEMLSGLDQMLRAVFLPGDFIWEDELKDGFPAQKYWYLYGRPKSQ